MALSHAVQHAAEPDQFAPDEAACQRRLRIVLVQAQAEGAGAQEISRILGRKLTHDERLRPPRPHAA